MGKHVNHTYLPPRFNIIQFIIYDVYIELDENNLCHIALFGRKQNDDFLCLDFFQFIPNNSKNDIKTYNSYGQIGFLAIDYIL